EQGLQSVVGYALPLRRLLGEPGALATGAEPGWNSGAWHLRGEHLFLLPGDSPMGYRLPLDALPWEAKGDRDELIERDPWQELGPLPTKAEILQRYVKTARSPIGVVPRDVYHNVIRTALCVEPRGGRLYVFMPPQRTA